MGEPKEHRSNRRSAVSGTSPARRLRRRIRKAPGHPPAPDGASVEVRCPGAADLFQQRRSTPVNVAFLLISTAVGLADNPADANKPAAPPAGTTAAPGTTGKVVTPGAPGAVVGTPKPGGYGYGHRAP